MDVSIHLLDEFIVEVDGRRVPASEFPRRSAVSLVKLLALTSGHRLHREQVMDALWPDAHPDGAANHLHKAAHYARRGAGEPACVVLRDHVVWLFPGARIQVDAMTVQDVAAELAAAEPASVDSGRAEAALGLFGAGPLPDDLYEPWATQHQQRLEAVHRQLLRWAGHWAELVLLDPRDEEANLGLARSMLARGDRAGALRQIDAIERILEDELGIGLSPEALDLRIDALDTPVAVPPVMRPEPTRVLPRHAGLATQRLGFCTAADGVRLAYATSGTGPPLVKAANWLTHLDYDWASPVWAHWWRTLSQSHRLVRYDERGCGLSEWDVPDASYAHIDVSDVARRVRAPTLVLHARDDQRPPFEQGQLLSRLIPDARFVALEGHNHILLEDEPAWPIFVTEVESFLAAQ